jgi:hypothetical protein
MADIADVANDDLESSLELARKQLQAAKPDAVASGVCLLTACGEALTDGRRWCDAECRDLWEKERKRLAR